MFEEPGKRKKSNFGYGIISKILESERSVVIMFGNRTVAIPEAKIFEWYVVTYHHYGASDDSEPSSIEDFELERECDEIDDDE